MRHLDRFGLVPGIIVLDVFIMRLGIIRILIDSFCALNFPNATYVRKRAHAIKYVSSFTAPDDTNPGRK